MRIKSNIVVSINNNNIIYLNPTLLYLDNEYEDIYKMNYITQELLKDDSIILEIKDYFSPFNMTKYFGSTADLNCNQTRILYKIW
jgi:hypothetical protein